MFSRKTWLEWGFFFAVALAACAGANGDPAPSVPDAGSTSGDISCVDAGAE